MKAKNILEKKEIDFLSHFQNLVYFKTKESIIKLKNGLN